MSDQMNSMEDDVEVHELVPVTDSARALDRAVLDVQIATAKSYPRNVTEFKRTALTHATLDKDTAASMFYTLERRAQDGSRKPILGPSVRLAEIVAGAWKNLRIDATIEGIDEKFVTAQATCLDLENNIGVRVRVLRRITDRKGRRYNEDMIGVTSQAAMSIAFRNAIFKVVPMAYVKPIFEAAKRAIAPDGKTMKDQRDLALAFFKGQGYTEAQVLALLGKRGKDDIDLDAIIILAGIRNACEEGTMTIESYFATANVEDEKATDLSAGLKERVKADPAAHKIKEIKTAKGDTLKWQCSCGLVFTREESASTHEYETARK